MADIKKLMELKEELEDAKNDLAELKGELKSNMKILLEAYECKTLKEAQAKQKEIEDKVKELDASLENKIQEIRDNFDLEI
jgi:uncharacterized protein YukE